MGLFPFISGLIGGGKQKKASRRAERAQVEALNRAIERLDAQQLRAEERYQPYVEAGTDALGGLRGLVGANGAEEQNVAIQALKNTPLYQQLFADGEEALLQTASATGGLRGGNTIEDIPRVARDSLLAAYDRQLSGLGGLAGLGIGATDSVSAFGANSAQGVAEALNQQGAARAGGLLTRGGITAGQFGSAGGFLDGLATSFAGGFGGGGGLAGGLRGVLKGLF